MDEFNISNSQLITEIGIDDNGNQCFNRKVIFFIILYNISFTWFYTALSL